MRKSKEEREIAAKAEVERQAARQASEAKANGSERGGYHAWGRGRGGFGDMSRGKDQRFNMSHGATGHLGGSTLGEATKGRRGRGGYGGGSGGGGGGGGGGEGGEGGVVEGEAGRGLPRDGGGGGGHATASDSTSTRVKKEPTVKGEKEKDGDVVMGSSVAKSKPKRTKIKREDQAPTYVSSDEEFDSDGKERMDIERINLVTDGEGSNDESNPVSEIAKGKKRERLPQPRLDLLRPVRIQRQEHVERAVGVDTNASSLTSAELRRRAKERNEGGGSLFLPEEEEDAEILYSQKVKGRRKTKDVEFVKDERKWKGVYQDEDDKDRIVKIKDGPKDEGDVMLIDKPLQTEGPERMAVDEGETIPLSGAIQNTLPDISGSVPQHTQDIDKTARDIADMENTHPNTQDQNRQQPDEERARAGLYHKAYRPPTREEIELAKAELSAETDEIDAILAEIESKTSTSESAPAAKSDNTNDPVDLSHEASAILSIIEGANYIFQLPPLLPSLRDASKKPPPPDKVPKLKPKPTLPTPDTPKPSTKTTTTITTTTNPFATTIKEEQDTKPDPDALGPAPSIPHTYISGGIYHPVGHVGSFRVHRGGKLSASWGGIGMEVGRGGGGKVNTLQELVVTEFGSEVVKREDAEGTGTGGVWEEKVRVGERVWALGMTQPGFVAVPGLGGVLS